MIKYYKWIAITFISMLVFYGNICFAQGIKERMKERLPAIVELKNKGVIGENNAGLLQFIGNKQEGAEIVTAENADRMKVYEAIAKQQSATVEIVASRRAQQIAEKADAGEWLQDESGKWYQKK